jgi:hypothetical protein
MGCQHITKILQNKHNNYYCLTFRGDIMHLTVFTIKLVVGLLFLANAGVVLAQSANDLADPKLNAHMNLAQNNPPDTPIPQMLAHARALAPLKGLAWKGLDITVSGHEVLPPGSLSAALLQLYQKQTCQADAIAVGHMTSSAYHLSAAGAAVYGDHIFTVDALWKDNPAATIRPKPHIVITRPGGSLLLDDGPVNFEMQMFPRFQPGVAYLQFLRFIPESSAYQAINSFSTLVPNGNTWVIFRKDFSNLVLPDFAQTALLSTINAWLQSCK